MSKKLIKNMALLVALLALCLTAAFSASAATENGYTYTVTDGKATITAVDSTVTGDVVIPDTLGGYPVTGIEGTGDGGDYDFHGSFEGHTSLTSVTIPESVTSIGHFAFKGCTGLTNITIPQSVMSIGYNAFGGCTSLKKINWNAQNAHLDSFYEYCGAVFSYAGKLTNGVEVVFGDTVERIPWFAFSKNVDEEINGENDNITSVTISSSVKSIGKYAFYGCVNLTSVSIGNGVTSIGESVFQNCTGLTNVTIPDSVTSIGEYAFFGCNGLTDITIPGSVTSIGKYAFSGCTGLTRINWNAESVSDFNSSYEVFRYAGSAGDGIDVVFGDNVKRVPAYAFYVGDSSNSPKIKTVTIGNNVTSIGEYALANCTELTTITIPDSIESIGISAFYNTDWFNAQPYGDVYAGKFYYTYKGSMPENTSVVIKNETKGIVDSAFYGKSNLVEITIPDSVTNIAKNAFGYCESLKSVKINDLSSWCRIDFENSWSNPLHIDCYYNNNCCLYLNGEKVADLEIPNNVTSINDYAFYGYDALESVKISDSVTSIGKSAFYDCDQLFYADIPGSVESIGDGAFDNCGSLKYLSIENGVKNIGMEAFVGTNIRNLILPDSVTTFGWGAFGDCQCLNSVTIGNGVESITGRYNGSEDFDYDGAFYNCPNLTEIKLGKSIKTIEANAFTGLLNFPEVYFAGSEEEWQAVSVHNSNDMLLRGNMHYNADISHTHSYKDEIISSATCTEDGRKLVVCDCGKIISFETVPAKGHTPSAWIYETGSCTEGGTRYKECVDCGEIVESEEVKPTEHTLVTDPAVAATCTTSGLSEGSHCSVCGEVLTEQEFVPATGHTEVYTEYVEPTCTEDGKTVGKVCSVCGEVIIPAVTIPARGHHYTEWIVTANPTCTVDGKQIKICACGLFEEESIPAAGHADADGDGVCDNCLCVTDGTQQGEEEKPNSFFARIREFFAKLIEMFKNLFK